jgi:hypothetical protein
MTRKTLWTVTHLPEGMDILGTALDEWTSRPQDAHTLLGQVNEWTTDLPTAAWITARMDDAVTHTAHSVDCYRNSFWGKTTRRMDESENQSSKDSLTNYVGKIPVDKRSKTDSAIQGIVF